MDRLHTTPIQIEVIQGHVSNAGFSTDYLVLYGLRGRVRVSTGKKEYDLETGGILTITPFTYYDFHCLSDDGFVILHIQQSYLRIVDANNRLAYVLCYAQKEEPSEWEGYSRVRKSYAKLFECYFQETAQRDVQLFSETNRLVSELIESFSEPDPVMQMHHDSAVVERLIRIMTYVHANWRDDISIEQLSRREYISAGYLSRFFKKYIGMTFTEYVVKLRLQNAMRDLEFKSDTVTKIALENGFKNVNAFISYFKTAYGYTPNQYRRNVEREILAESSRGRQMPQNDGIDKLLDHIVEDVGRERPPEPGSDARRIDFSAADRTSALTHTWCRLMNIGYARSGLLAEVQNRIRQAQEEIGFEYVRFHGILDDDMHLYHEDCVGNVELDFSRVDLLMDFIDENKLKPYIELSYMPGLLAKSRKKVFERDSYVSAYRDEEKWKLLIRGLMLHLIERYGIDKVQSWKFTTIGCNCVDSGIVAEEDYLRLYRVTRECVKETDEEIQFGGPGGWISSLWNEGCIRRFFEYSIENHCVPDFVCVQCYPHQIIQADDAFWQYTRSQSLAPSVLSDDVHYLRTAIESYRALLKEMGLAKTEIWIEEWNSTIWQRDLSGDTRYKAAWLVQNICENYDVPAALGYWSLSDFIEESAHIGGAFQGGIGLFTYHGIPKSGWHALRLLRRMGNEKINASEGWMATKSGRTIQIIMCNYCHYGSLYRLRYKKLTDPQKAYEVFEKKPDLHFKIHIRGLEAGMYRVKTYLISGVHGSSFDAWMQLGTPEYLSREEIAYLHNLSVPFHQVETKELRNDFSAECRLRPHEVMLIILEAI